MKRYAERLGPFLLALHLLLVSGVVCRHVLRDLEKITPDPDDVDSDLGEGSYPSLGPDETNEDAMTPVDEDSCPRSREDASAKGRSCLRKCKFDADCISSRKKCLCDGLCGWSCIRPDLHCDELTAVENGQFKVTADMFGARVTYNCVEGFWMSGARERVCQGDGSWSDHAPECRKKAVCGAPPTVPHARHSAPMDKNDFDIDDMVQYNCFPGYDAKGFARAKCMFYNSTAQWFGPDLKCIPRSCGHPGDVENGRREGVTFTFTSRVTYECLDGYELVGRANRYCQSNGQWSGLLPSCRPVQCSLPADPMHGRALYTAVTFNSNVKYECRYGYRLNGPVTRRCGALKQWEGTEPTCEEIDCGSPGTLHNGYLENRSNTLGSVVIFRCFDGMKFEGPSMSTTCQQDGKWSHSLPKCLSSCVVPTIEHSRGYQVPPGSRLAHDQEIAVECKAHYEPAYNATPAICRNGTWSHLPVCAPERCKQLPDRPRHGMVIAPKTEHGMRALFKCKDGFELDGANVTECHFGKWSASTPKCKEIYCKFPGNLTNGRVLLVGHMGMYDYRPYVRKVTNNRQIMYECNRGFALQEGPPGATCVAGYWSPSELPQCLPGSHPHVRFSRALKKRRNQEKDGKWKGRRRYRRDKGPCSPIPEAPWMEIDIIRLGKGNATVPHGTVVNVTCSRGYKLSLGENRTTAKCAHGHWKPSRPECLTLPCQVPYMSHGVFHHFQNPLESASKVAHGELVILTCVPGFRVTGAESVRCWYGDWAVDSMPDCAPGPCQLPAISEGHYLGGYRAGLTISHGASVDYACKAEWLKRPDEPLRCTEGRLEPESPACVDPSAIKVSTGTGREDEAQTSPPPEERRNRTCIFRNSEPNVMAFDGDRVITEDALEFPADTELVFRCKDIGKFTLTGSVRRRCRYGDWDGVKPSCFGLSQENDYAQKPPTILFRHQLAPIAQSNDGKLIVYPGTILHLECLWIRKYGTPTWEISHSYRKYPEGWTNEPGRDAQLEYRLSIYHALRDDSGRYTCVSPMGHRHSVDIVVAAIHCPTLPDVPGLRISTPNSKMNTEVLFSCAEGQTLYGSEQTACLPSGNWSTGVPSCKVTECPDIVGIVSTATNGSSTSFKYEGLEISVDRRLVGSVANYACPKGYGLRGSPQVTCLDTGQWSDGIPECEEVICDLPEAPENGYLQGHQQREYRGGDVVQFGCNAGYMMDGTAIVVCQENSRWSGPAPSCVPACTYPGMTPGATILNLKFYYRINETVTFECADGHELRGAKMLQCLENGRWSSAIPTCTLTRKG